VSEQVLVPADPRAMADLAVLVARARRADPDGAARLVAAAGVLAVWVSPLHGAGLPTVLGLRALALAEPAGTEVAVDTTVSLAAVAERLARSTQVLPVPPVQVLTASWAGVTPPRGGWAPLPDASAAALRSAARDGAALVAAGSRPSQVWREPLPGAAGEAGGTTALAQAADVLGFLAGDDVVHAARSGPWVRLSTARGHVLARPPLLG